jgi:hypothetical protein
MSVIEISIAKQFSRTPGGRYRRHGPFSGEDFRERILWPALQEKAASPADVVQVSFDGVAGMPSSFLEEAFGGLVRKDARAAQRVRFSATDPALLPYVTLAQKYVREASERRAS